MKNALLTILLYLFWIVIMVPLALVVFLITTILGWPIYVVVKIIDNMQSRLPGVRNSETVEEGIVVIYALSLLIMCAPFEIPTLRKQMM